jgi:hypothetical protein
MRYFKEVFWIWATAIAMILLSFIIAARYTVRYVIQKKNKC